MVESPGQLSVCPRCGSRELLFVTRDSWPTPEQPIPPRQSFGEWVVCGACNHEWAAPDPPLVLDAEARGAGELDGGWPEDLEKPVAAVHMDADVRMRCARCSREVKPVVTKHKPDTSGWWDDPSPFVACPRGHFLDSVSVDDFIHYAW
jgi:DNA-directed RNA polymerase subunit RPC12/RpoP